MTCNGDSCPIHGKRYMKSIKIGFDGNKRVYYCAGCHAGEMAVREEYERRLVFDSRDINRKRREG